MGRLGSAAERAFGPILDYPKNILQRPTAGNKQPRDEITAWTPLHRWSKPQESTNGVTSTYNAAIACVRDKAGPMIIEKGRQQ